MGDSADILQTLLAPLVALGLPGILIVFLGFALYKMSNLYHEIQEKRIEENKEAVRVMGEMSKALDGLSELIRDRARGN